MVLRGRKHRVASGVQTQGITIHQIGYLPFCIQSQLRFGIGFKVHYALLCLLCAPRAYKYYIHTEDKLAKRLSKLYVATLLIGVACWLCDRLFCKKIQGWYVGEKLGSNK